MRLNDLSLPGLVLIEPDVFEDQRGFFLESWNQQSYQEAGLDITFVQDNLSFSRSGVLRGLHFQNPKAQGKLIYVLQGEIYDVVVDIRPGSPSFGKWEGMLLSAENRLQLLIPAGFAHGFCTTSCSALITYKCTNLFYYNYECGILWNDPDLAVKWPVQRPLLSRKDANLPFFKDLDMSSLSTCGNE